MLVPIDFLHSPQNQDEYLLSPKVIHDQILAILNDRDKEWSLELHTRFALLNRMIWAISILNAIDSYRDFAVSDIATFFLAFSVFNEIIEAFEKDKPDTTVFTKTLQEEVFGEDIVESKDDYSFTRFIRSLSVAHTTNTDRGGRFLKSGHTFVLLSIDIQSAAPTCSEIKDSSEAFYFHVLVLTNEKSDQKIFKLYIDELKKYLKYHYDSCDFEKLEKPQGPKA